MKKIILISTIFTALLTTSFIAQAEIYKWKDSKGVIHYSAKPPVQKRKAQVKVKNIEKKIKSAAGKHRPSVMTKKSLSNDDDKNGKQNNLENMAPPSHRLVAYCAAQRKSLSTLKENFRNIWKDLDGTEKRLNQAERKDKINYLIKRIAEDCEGI